jgi:hypothetical protein
MSFNFHVQQYLGRRAADWEARGFTETLRDSAALNRRSKFWGDDGRAAFRNWEDVKPSGTLFHRSCGDRSGCNQPSGATSFARWRTQPNLTLDREWPGLKRGGRRYSMICGGGTSRPIDFNRRMLMTVLGATPNLLAVAAARDSGAWQTRRGTSRMWPLSPIGR